MDFVYFMALAALPAALVWYLCSKVPPSSRFALPAGALMILASGFLITWVVLWALVWYPTRAVISNVREMRRRKAERALRG